MVMGPQSRVWNGPKYTTSLWDWGFFHQDPLIFVRLVGPQLKEQESHISHLHKGLVFECHFTPWTIKSDHVAWPFPVVQLPWSSFLTKSIYKAFGPLARCKPNVNQEEWPCTKKWMRWFCLIHVPKRRVWKKVHVGPLCCPLFPKRFPLKIQCNNISWPWGPWPFSTRAPLLPPPPQNPLDHINAWRRPSNMSFGDLKLHGHSNYFPFSFFPLDANRNDRGTSSTTNQKFYRALGRRRFHHHGPGWKQPMCFSFVVEARRIQCRGGWCGGVEVQNADVNTTHATWSAGGSLVLLGF